ncbi:RfbX Membrane protein involved in the export of O-antigen and teichoic acid [Burkholderiaceae bacterium]
MNIVKYCDYVRLRPFELNSEVGRAQERYRLATLTALTSILSKGAMMLVMVFSVTISLPYLGVERFGVWMTIASIVGLLNFLDLGVGNALVNRVAQAAIHSNKSQLGKCIGAGLIILALISIAIGTFLYLIAVYLPWHKLLKMSNIDLYTETYIAIKVFAILFSLHILTSGISRIFYGLQRGYEANMLSALGSFLSLILIWGAINFNGGIASLLAANMLGGVFISFILLGVLVKRGQVNFHRLIENIQIEAPRLLKTGGSFLFLQIGTMVVFGVDNLIVASSLGAVMVTTFSITQRLFQFVTQPFAILNSGLWPAYANAHEHGDKKFIKSTLKRSMGITIFGSITVSLVLIFFGEEIISLWTQKEVSVTYSLLIAFAIWSVMDVGAGCFAMFMNGTSLIKIQSGCLVTLIIIGIPLKIYLANQLGLQAMLMGFSLFFFINILFWYGLMHRKKIFGTIS